jgi:hypothetical protein
MQRMHCTQLDLRSIAASQSAVYSVAVSIRVVRSLDKYAKVICRVLISWPFELTQIVDLTKMYARVPEARRFWLKLNGLH